MRLRRWRADYTLVAERSKRGYLLIDDQPTRTKCFLFRRSAIRFINLLEREGWRRSKMLFDTNVTRIHHERGTQ